MLFCKDIFTIFVFIKMGCSAKDTSELKIISAGEIFDVPGGYHFIAPVPGYRLSYSWALGGEQKGLGKWVNDPNHEWLAKL